MSWLANRLGLHVNLRPLAAPAGALLGGLIGGPLGAGLGAGLFKTGDNVAHGDNLGHAVGQGVLNGALAYGGANILDKLRTAFAPGSSAASATFGGGPAAGGAITAPGAGGVGDLISAGGNAATSQASPSLLSRIGSFASHNPTAIGQGLQGLGAIAQAPAENALRRAQVQGLDLQNQGNAYDLASRKARDAAMAPLRLALMQQFSGIGKYPIAANPYL